MLSRIDGQTLGIAELMAICSMGEEETLRCVCALAVDGGDPVGVVRRARSRSRSARGAGELASGSARRGARHRIGCVGAPSPSDDVDSTLAGHRRRRRPSIGQVTHYELLEISRDASHSQVKAGFFSLTKRYHPDRHRADAFRDVQTDLENILIGLRDAYDVLGHPVHRVGYDSNLPPVAGAESEPVATGSFDWRRRGSSTTPQPAEGSAGGRGKYVGQACRSPSRRRRRWRSSTIAPGRSTSRRRTTTRPSRAFGKRSASTTRRPTTTGCSPVRSREEPAVEGRRGETLHAGHRARARSTPSGYVELARLYEEGGLATRAKKVYEQVLELNPDHEVARERTRRSRRTGRG